MEDSKRRWCQNQGERDQEREKVKAPVEAEKTGRGKRFGCHVLLLLDKNSPRRRGKTTVVSGVDARPHRRTTEKKNSEGGRTKIWVKERRIDCTKSEKKNRKIKGRPRKKAY